MLKQNYSDFADLLAGVSGRARHNRVFRRRRFSTLEVLWAQCTLDQIMVGLLSDQVGRAVERDVLKVLAVFSKPLQSSVSIQYIDGALVSPNIYAVDGFCRLYHDSEVREA